MYESNDEESDQIKQDRLRNRQIEYELFRTILPSDIYIYPHLKIMRMNSIIMTT